MKLSNKEKARKILNTFDYIGEASYLAWIAEECELEFPNISSREAYKRLAEWYDKIEKELLK